MEIIVIMNSEEQEKIRNEIIKKIPMMSCPMCKTHKFTLNNGYFLNSLQTEFTDGLTFGGPVIPTISLVCNNCGFVSQHAVGVLGLLPKNENNDAE